MKKLKYMAAFAATVLIGSTTSLSAAPVQFCKSGGINLVTQGCISGKSTAYTDGGDDIYENTGGGDPEAAVELAIFGATGNNVDISLYGKYDLGKASTTFNLTFDAGSDGKSGTWDVVDDLIKVAYITIKGGNSFVLFDVQGVNSGSWTTEGLKNKKNNNQPEMSHISFWTVPSLTTVPLPAAGWLLMAGLGGFAAVKRRKSV